MSRSEQKELTRQKILGAIGRGFRRGGYGGVGVDALAKEAGVTSGAFYVHFGSKAEAFRAAATGAVAEVAGALRQLQADQPTAWWPVFVRFYLGPKRQCALDDSCGLQSLASEVARADDAARAGFEAELRQVAEVIAAGPPMADAPEGSAAALAALATLVGAVTLARAMQDPAMADQITRAAEASLLPTSAAATATERKPKRG